MQATTLTNLLLLLVCSVMLFGTWSRELAKAIGFVGLMILFGVVVYLFVTFGTIP